MAPLPHTFVPATALLRERCAERRRGGQASSFVVAGRDGMPAEPGSVLPAYHVRQDVVTTPSRGEQHGEPVATRAGMLRLDDHGGLRVRGGPVPHFSQAALDQECARAAGRGEASQGGPGIWGPRRHLP